MADVLRKLTDSERLERLEAVVFEIVQSVWEHLGTERCRQLLEIMTPTHAADKRPSLSERGAPSEGPQA